MSESIVYIPSDESVSQGKPKEITPSPKEFVDIFSELSGLTREELSGYIGADMSTDLGLPYPDIIKKHFPGGVIDANTAPIVQGRFRAEEKSGNPDFARWTFWRGLIRFKVNNDPDYKSQHPEAIKATDIDSSGLLVFIDQAYDRDLTWKLPSDPEAIAKIENNLVPGETLQVREEYINQQLNDAMETAKSIRQSGKIPVFRWLHFPTSEESGQSAQEREDQRKRIIDNAAERKAFLLRYPLPLDQLSLQDVDRHTSARDLSSDKPIDSWTAMPPSGWMFESSKLGHSNSLLEISAVSLDEITMSHRSYAGDAESTQFYLINDDGKKTTKPLETKLTDLQSGGIIGCFMPSEWELAVFSELPVAKVIDFKHKSPNSE